MQHFCVFSHLSPAGTSSSDSIDAWHDLLFDTLATSCGYSSDDESVTSDTSDTGDTNGPDTPPHKESILFPVAVVVPGSSICYTAGAL